MKTLGWQNLIVLAVLLFFVCQLLSGCSLVGPIDSTVLDKICLEGHAYWSNGDPSLNNFAFAPILTDDGKPVLCNGKTKNERQ